MIILYGIGYLFIGLCLGIIKENERRGISLEQWGMCILGWPVILFLMGLSKVIRILIN